MGQPILLYIGTSKAKEIHSGGSVTWEWGSYGAWTKFKSPVTASTKYKPLNLTAKNKVGASKYGGMGGVTVLGSSIPATKPVVRDGVTYNVPVRYYQRGYTKYIKNLPAPLRLQMMKLVYTKDNPYQYRIQLKDKMVVDKTYSSYSDGYEYIYFADYYYNGSTRVQTTGHMMHPREFTVSYSDVHRNLNQATNNQDGRDNKGNFVLSNVRANVVTLNMTWEGLSAEDGADLLDTLNPTKTSSGQYNYLIVQFVNPATGRPVNKTFYASDRQAEQFANGHFRSISVTLTEV